MVLVPFGSLIFLKQNPLNVFKWAAVISCNQKWNWKGERVFANELLSFFFCFSTNANVECWNVEFLQETTEVFSPCHLFTIHSLLFEVDLKLYVTIHTMLWAHFVFLLPRACHLFECNSSELVIHKNTFMNEPQLPNCTRITSTKGSGGGLSYRLYTTSVF